MKKIILGLAATAALAAAMPAAAQSFAPSMRDLNYREARLNQQIRYNAQRGLLTGYEVRDLRIKMAEVDRLERYYARGGFSYQEIQVLNRKLDNVAYLLRVNSRDDQTRWNDGRWRDRDRDGYRDNDWNRDGYPDRRW